jgi:pyruvate/2-oxoglutarate dehydrogenase complex dihydrolipoamide dehydrogenase (E3) component
VYDYDLLVIGAGSGGVRASRIAAHFRDAHAVEVDGRRVTAKYILVATGGHPSLPEVPGIEHRRHPPDRGRGVRDAPREAGRGRARQGAVSRRDMSFGSRHRPGR